MGGILGVGLYDARQELVDDAVTVDANMVFVFDQALPLCRVIRQRAPWMKIVGRPWLGNTEEQVDIVRRSDGRLVIHDHIAGLIGLYPEIDYWQAFNEIYGMGQFDILRAQMEAEKGAADACREAGKGLLLYNGGPGTTPTKQPDDTRRADWEPWRDIVVPMFSYPGVAYLGMHAYGMDLPARLPQGASWYMLRHRYLVDGLASEGIKTPPICLTEFGHGGDYKRFLNEQEVITDYEWYGAEILKDSPAITCAFQFCTGDSGGWTNMDIHGTSIIPAMGDWNAAHPVPWTEPQQGEEEMPIDQAKIDQLLAQNALITDALVALREGRLTGADGVDGYIAALRGGQVPAGYAPVGPSYPPKN